MTANPLPAPPTGAEERVKAALESAGWWIGECPDGDLYGQLETDSGLKEFRIDPETIALLTKHLATAVPAPPTGAEITPELQDALARLKDDHRRFRHIPGYFDGPIELGDWTLINRAIDPGFQATREGAPDPPGTIPATAVPDAAVIASFRLMKAAHDATAEEQRTAAIVDKFTAFDVDNPAYDQALDEALDANRVARRARAAVTKEHIVVITAWLAAQEGTGDGG